MYNNFQFDKNSVLRPVEMFFNRKIDIQQLCTFLHIVWNDVKTDKELGHILKDIFVYLDNYKNCGTSLTDLKKYVQDIAFYSTLAKGYDPEEYDD